MSYSVNDKEIASYLRVQSRIGECAKLYDSLVHNSPALGFSFRVNYGHTIDVVLWLGPTDRFDSFSMPVAWILADNWEDIIRSEAAKETAKAKQQKADNDKSKLQYLLNSAGFTKDEITVLLERMG